MAQKYLDYEGLKQVITGLQSYAYSLVGTSTDAIQTALDTKQPALVWTETYAGANDNTIKTINGQSLAGPGDITIDLSLYKVVDALPESGIDENKIYLIITKEDDTVNKYTEYIYVNSAWEKLGEYVASIDLEPYLKIEDAAKLYITYDYAANTYLSKADAETIYVTYTNATSYYYDKATIDDKTKNALSDAEKKWIASQLFESLFKPSITASPSSVQFAGSDVTVTFTLQTKYDGTLVDLDEVPSGWTRTSTGTYTKTGTINASTGSSINSGSVACVYQGNTKTASAASCTNIKPSYILLSTKESLTTDDLTDLETAAQKISSSNTIKGDKTINITTTGSYVYFIISNTSTLTNVQQLGLDYLQSNTGTSLTRTNYGTYKIYRSKNAMSAGSQTVTLS